jgi:hypothetical protein
MARRTGGGVMDKIIQDYENEIRLIQAYNKGLLEKIVQLERERDAAVRDLEANKRCETCMYYTPGYFCLGCRNGSDWQWRGVEGVRK